MIASHLLFGLCLGQYAPNRNLQHHPKSLLEEILGDPVQGVEMIGPDGPIPFGIMNGMMDGGIPVPIGGPMPGMIGGPPLSDGPHQKEHPAFYKNNAVKNNEIVEDTANLVINGPAGTEFVFTDAPHAGLTVSCGSPFHRKSRCEDCPIDDHGVDHKQGWCNGDCVWRTFDVTAQGHGRPKGLCMRDTAIEREMGTGLKVLFESPLKQDFKAPLEKSEEKEKNGHPALHGDFDGIRSINGMEFMDLIHPLDNHLEHSVDGLGNILADLPPPSSFNAAWGKNPAREIGENGGDFDTGDSVINAIYDEMDDDEQRATLDQLETLARVTKSHDACGFEMQTICRESRTMHCLAHHHSNVSPPCKKLVEKSIHFRCLPDTKTHCDGLNEGLLDCLRSKMKSSVISKDCFDALIIIDAFIHKVKHSPEIHFTNNQGHLIHSMRSATKLWSNKLHRWWHHFRRHNHFFIYLFQFLCFATVIFVCFFFFHQREVQRLVETVWVQMSTMSRTKGAHNENEAARVEAYNDLNREYGTCI